MWQVSDIIQTTIDRRSPISHLVAFPTSGFLIGPPSLGHINSVALVRLVDATIWMLVLERQPWTDERLQAAADVLAGVSKQAFTAGSVECSLRKRLGIRSLSVAPPPLERIDERVWEIEKVAFAFVRQPAASRSGTMLGDISLSEREWTTRTDLRNGLGNALRGFVSAMDRKALRIAGTDRRFDMRIYNYLAHSGFRRYRQQFAETFPSLLQTAVVAEPRSLGEDLRSIVDSGTPLVRGLAARWGVRPGVIRHLVGRASSNVGYQWTRDARGLALALDALHPQDLPADSPREWNEFNRMVAIGQELFGQPVWKSAAGLEWLRECARLMKREDTQALGLWLPAWNGIGTVSRFRAALAETLRREAVKYRTTPANSADSVIDDAVDRVVLKMARQGLQDIASLYEEELTRTRKEDYTVRILSREILLPLVPEDFFTSDGRTRVTPLTTDRQLRAHGARMRNCLRSRSARTVARQARIGMVFIVGIYDVVSTKALSTAEIRAYSDREPGAYRLVTKQHTATANRTPSMRCRRTLQEFLCYCQTSAVREHLTSNWQSFRRPDTREDGQSFNIPAALRRALGDNVYEGLLSRVRNAASQTKRAREGPAFL